MKHRIISALFISAAMAFSHSASALVLSNVTWRADSFNTFSPAGFNAASAAGIVISAVGNTEQMPDVTVTDPESGEATQVPVFRYPVTQSKVKLLVNHHLASTEIGWTARSGLKMTRGSHALALVNFQTDFVKKILYADIITPTGTTMQAEVFTFTVESPIYADLKKGKIVATGAVNSMMMTQSTIDLIASTLKLSNSLKGPMATIDWGRVDVDVSSALRLPKTNNKPLVAADVGIDQSTATTVP